MRFSGHENVGISVSVIEKHTSSTEAALHFVYLQSQVPTKLKTKLGL